MVTDSSISADTEALKAMAKAAEKSVVTDAATNWVSTTWEVNSMGTKAVSIGLDSSPSGRTGSTRTKASPDTVNVPSNSAVSLAVDITTGATNPSDVLLDM